MMMITMTSMMVATSVLMIMVMVNDGEHEHAYMILIITMMMTVAGVTPTSKNLDCVFAGDDAGGELTPAEKTRMAMVMMVLMMASQQAHR